MATKTSKAAGTENKPAGAPRKRAFANFPDCAKPEEARALADFSLRSSVNAAAVVGQYGKETFGDLDMGALAASLSDGIKAVNNCDLQQVEGMLFGQAIALQTIFTNMARRAPKQDMMVHWEAYMRMALKAQSQCRMTLETLAGIKNPPMVFARQANINNGGQQQVNNGTPASNENCAVRAGAPTYAGNSSIEPSKLLSPTEN